MAVAVQTDDAIDYKAIFIVLIFLWRTSKKNPQLCQTGFHFYFTYLITAYFDTSLSGES
jgi:hypothetical protein